VSDRVPGWAIAATNPSETEVSRLKAQLRAHPTRRFHRRYPILVGVAVAVAALALFVQPPSYGDAPSPGTTVRLSEEPVSLGPSIRLTGEGVVTVEAAGPSGTVVTLPEGLVVADVDPGGRFREFQVRAPGDVVVTVVGTRFSVEYTDEGRVAVERGEVRVETGVGEPRTLRAGDSWTWEGGDATGEVLDDRLSSTSEGAPGLPGGVGRRSGDAASEGLSAGAEVTEQDRPAPAPGLAAARPVDASPVVPPAPPSASASPAEDADAVAVLDPSPGGEPAPSSASAPLDPIERARRFDLIGAAMDDGDPARAAALAEAFSVQNAGHALAAEAGYLRVVALAEVDPKASMFAASAWLAEHPQGGRRGEVLYLHATMAHDRLGDCRLALPSYEEASRLAAGDLQARSLAYLGLCALKTGDDDVAAAALQSALLHTDLPAPLRPRLLDAQRSLNQSPR